MNADILNILKRNVRSCDIKLIKDARHGFAGFETELSNSIGKWIKQF